MKIDASRVNLTEKDIEDWLYENPSVLVDNYISNPIERWIGRQYQLPSGIADLIGVRQGGRLVVVEVKNVAINKAAVLQVCRYTNDLACVLRERTDYPHKAANYDPLIDMMLVGPNIDDQTFIEASALGVCVFEFAVELSLGLSELEESEAYYEQKQGEYKRIGARPEWDIYGVTTDVAFQEYKSARDAGPEQAQNESVADPADAYLVQLLDPES